MTLHTLRSARLVPACLLVAILGTTACGVEQLPPPAAPEKHVPAAVDVPAEPPAPGRSRVVLDANGEKAQVYEITGVATAHAGRYSAHVVGTRPVCSTPCVVDLSYGTHPLVFTSKGDEKKVSEVELEVGARPKVFRHAMGERNDGGAARTAGGSLLVLGFLAATTGAILWGVAAAAKSSSGQPSSLEGPGQAITGAGALGIGLSLPLLWLGRPTERKGTTTEWEVTPAAPSAPSSGVTAQQVL